MNDLAQLTALLNSFGPWGIVAAVVLTAAAPKVMTWLKSRFPNWKGPSAPASPANPAPGPLANPGPLDNRPVLNLLLASLRQLLANRNPGRDPDQLVIQHLASQLGVAAVDLDTEPLATTKV